MFNTKQCPDWALNELILQKGIKCYNSGKLENHKWQLFWYKKKRQSEGANGKKQILFR